MIIKTYIKHQQKLQVNISSASFNELRTPQAIDYPFISLLKFDCKYLFIQLSYDRDEQLLICVRLIKLKLKTLLTDNFSYHLDNFSPVQIFLSTTEFFLPYSSDCNLTCTLVAVNPKVNLSAGLTQRFCFFTHFIFIFVLVIFFLKE